MRTQEARCKKYRWTERDERKWTDFYNMIFSLEICKLIQWGKLAKKTDSWVKDKVNKMLSLKNYTEQSQEITELCIPQ